jgi:hypothetical protein
VNSSQDRLIDVHTHPASLALATSRRTWLGRSAALLAASSLAACGGGGSSGDGGGSGSGGSGPTGLIIAKSTADLSVYKAATRNLTTYPASSKSLRVGISASRAGVIGDVANGGGSGQWGDRAARCEAPCR